MPSMRDQRATARAKLEQKMFEKASAAHRKRRMQIIAASGLAVVLVGGIVATIVALTGDGDDDTATENVGNEDTADDQAAEPGWCEYVPDGPEEMAANANLVDAGQPEDGIQPHTGTQTMTIDTDLGTITAEIDTANAPCTAASFTHLAGQGYLDDSQCHRLTTEGIYVLQCGDPTGTGLGGPTYSFTDENLPPESPDNYPAGTVAMANSGPNTNGSQFFIVYEVTFLPPDYTIFGQLTEGMDIVQDIAAAGVSPDSQWPDDGPPAEDVTIDALTMSEPE